MRVTLLPQEGAGSQCIPSGGKGVLPGVCPWMGQGQPALQQQEERRACSTDLAALAVSGQQVPQGQVSTVVSREQLELSPAACERQHRPSCQAKPRVLQGPELGAGTGCGQGPCQPTRHRGNTFQLLPGGKNPQQLQLEASNASPGSSTNHMSKPRTWPRHQDCRCQERRLQLRNGVCAEPVPAVAVPLCTQIELTERGAGAVWQRRAAPLAPCWGTAENTI